VVTYCGLGKIVLNVDNLCFIVIRSNQHRLNTMHYMSSGVRIGCCVNYLTCVPCNPSGKLILCALFVGFCY